MLRAMDSGVAGLRSHQNKLDVISNNIANVNTFGFKAQSYSFKDAMYQTSTASAAGKVDTTSKAASTGGMNAAQYGYGSLTGSISTDFTSSTPSYVGGFNASINGAGFFVTNSKNITDGITNPSTDNMKAGNFSYTRVGQLKVDSNGFIVDSNGNYVYGFRADEKDLSNPTVFGGSDDAASKVLHVLRAPDGLAVTKENNTVKVTGKFTTDITADASKPAQLKSVEIGNDGTIKAIVEITDTTTKETNEYSIILGKVGIASFQNQEGLQKAGNNTFTAFANDNTGAVSVTEPGKGATPTLMAGYLEASNVDLAKEFSDMITTQRGFQANSKIITVSDEILQELVNMKR